MDGGASAVGSPCWTSDLYLAAASCGIEATTKSKLASLNEKLDGLERKLEVLEVQVSSATTNPSVFNN
ncbi:protein BRICK 1 [Hordeum vulgare]|nr:protein BRICK 1 [Hordeum vulgare]